ncbi:MAG: YgfZ/GcvT domain-containing protein, partial [Rhodospirillales bacterium]
MNPTEWPPMDQSSTPFPPVPASPQLVALDAPLSRRGVITIAGDDRLAFLQGLVSNDVTHVRADRAIWAAFLTAQGKYLFDFFVTEGDGAFRLDLEADRAGDFLKRLKLYKLRSKVELAEVTEGLKAFAVIGEGAAERFGLSAEAGAAKAFGDGVAFVDPRLAEAGVRILTTEDSALAALGLPMAEAATYDRLRIALGLPDASRDLLVDKTTLLEAGFDELRGIDWQKGCYMGQELTARTKYRGLIKKRLMPVRFDGPTPEAGTAVLAEDRDAGEVRSSAGDLGLAFLRLDALGGGAALTAGTATLHPLKPAWANF